MRHLKVIFCFIIVVMMFFLPATSPAKDILVGYSGPLSGAAAEYGQDIFSGIDMAVREINDAGGITVKGQKYKFRLEKLNDHVDPTMALKNARRLQENGAIAVFNSVFTTVAPMLRINQEKGKEFLLMAYTSSPRLMETGNKLVVAPPAFYLLRGDTHGMGPL